MRLMQSFRRTSSADADAVPGAICSSFTHPAAAAVHLNDIESRLRAAAAICDNHLVDMSLHLIEGGGKRLRPLLAVSSAIAIGGEDGVTDRVLDAGVVVELLHLATLYHDDVLDSAPLRRGRPSANALWGNHTAVLGGDVLLAQSFRMAAGLGPDELRRLCQTLTDICSGQIAEGDVQFDCSREIDHYHASIRGKTAALLSTSCWLGASTAGASRAALESLAQYGTELGIAFQIIDDVLDLYGDSHVVGKVAGCDLRQGILTLPVLLTLQADPTIVGLLVKGIDENGIAEVGRRVRAVGADRHAVAVGLDHVHSALCLLASCDLTAVGKHLLTSITERMLQPLRQLGFGLDIAPDIFEDLNWTAADIVPGLADHILEAERCVTLMHPQASQPHPSTEPESTI